MAAAPSPYDNQPPQQPAPVVQPFVMPTYAQQPFVTALPTSLTAPPVRNPIVRALTMAAAPSTATGGVDPRRFAAAVFPQRAMVDPIRLLLRALRGPH